MWRCDWRDALVAAASMTRIVRTHHHYKRPPRKRKAVVLDVPAVVSIQRKPRRSVATHVDTPEPMPVVAPRRSAIITGSAPDMMPEESTSGAAMPLRRCFATWCARQQEMTDKDRRKLLWQTWGVVLAAEAMIVVAFIAGAFIG